jgi:hypothetical protein
VEGVAAVVTAEVAAAAVDAGNHPMKKERAHPLLLHGHSPSRSLFTLLLNVPRQSARELSGYIAWKA